MRVNVRVKNAKKTTAFVRWAKERIADSFARLSHQVRSVEAFFSDLNGPKGGRDQNLLLAVRLWNGQTIAVRAVDCDIGRALDDGVDRSIHSVIRRVERERSFRRSRWEMIPKELLESPE